MFNEVRVLLRQLVRDSENGSTLKESSSMKDNSFITMIIFQCWKRVAVRSEKYESIDDSSIMTLGIVGVLFNEDSFTYRWD